MFEDEAAPEEEAEPTGDMMGMDSAEPAGDEFSMEAEAFLNDALPIKERVAALKNAIMACTGTDYAEEKKEGKGGGSMFDALLSK